MSALKIRLRCAQAKRVFRHLAVAELDEGEEEGELALQSPEFGHAQKSRKKKNKKNCLHQKHMLMAEQITYLRTHRRTRGP